ncbi:hypothetical protein BBK36DRAFT_1105883, partial [Trichoderma citrinoviride]
LPSAVENCLDRFSLWAGNMGAFQTLVLSPAPLDLRLSSAQNLRKDVIQQMREIITAIQDLTTIILRKSPMRNTAVPPDIRADLVSFFGLDANVEIHDSALEEVDMLLQVISKCITSLFRLGTLIRKDPQSPLDQYQKLGNSQLAGRLSSAIAKRRRLFKYFSDNRLRRVPNSNSFVLVGSAPDKQTDKVMEVGESPSSERPKEGADRVSTTSASSRAKDHSVLKLSPIVDISNMTNEPFECPICFNPLSIQDERTWKKHTSCYLQPYICTIGGPDCDELFDHRDTWFEHELRKHRSQYRCTLCKQGGFSFQSVISHIAEHHGNFSESQLEFLRQGSRETPVAFDARDCPFCDRFPEIWASRSREREDGHNSETMVPFYDFKEHIAMHQERLAVMVLPQ